MFGKRVIVKQEIDRYPHFLVPVGLRGTIVQWEPLTIGVKLDNHIVGAEEWDNVVYWYGVDPNSIALTYEFWEQVDPLATFRVDFDASITVEASSPTFAEQQAVKSLNALDDSVAFSVENVRRLSGLLD